MTRVLLSRIALIAIAAQCFGCDVFKTLDSESVTGRGARAFDPYQSSASGAIRLSLQNLNGCEILPTGEPVVPGTYSFDIGYPAQCQDVNFNYKAVAPTARKQLVADQPYFLNQLTLEDVSVNLPKLSNPADTAAPLAWITQQSRFAGLDWTGVGINQDTWYPFDSTSFLREVFYGNATWMNHTDDTFTLDVLDPAGTVRQTAVYSHQDFLGESPVAGHTRVSWRAEGLFAPEFPGDTTVHNTAFYAPTFRTMFRLDLVGSTNPHNTFQVPFTGDAVIRVTWSELPGQPFYFPINVISASDIPKTCFGGASGTELVACDFGLQPSVKFSRPENGKFFNPGDTLNLYFGAKDGSGNSLIGPEFPSWNQYFTDDANGLLYSNVTTTLGEVEYDTAQAFSVIGPLQNLKPAPDINVTPDDWFHYPAASVGDPSYARNWPDIFAEQAFVPGMGDMKWPDHFPVTLSQNAPSGTYAAYFKTQRNFMGERLSRVAVSFFQVGTEEKTNYPGQVGNCQICHRSVLSLDNLRHGMSVDNVEGCKACHTNLNHLSHDLHQLHMLSAKYPLPKNDCSVCHLTRVSALRPSYDTCSSCHQTVHGDQYFALEFSTNRPPNRFSGCAEGCHVKTPPVLHILPKD